MHPQSSAMCSSCSVKVSGMVPLRCTPEFYRMGGAPVKVPRRGHQSRSAIASRRCWRDTSSFRMARSSLAVGLPSHSHSSSWKEVRSSKAVAMVPSSMGWGAVCSGILQGRGRMVNPPGAPRRRRSVRRNVLPTSTLRQG